MNRLFQPELLPSPEEDWLAAGSPPPGKAGRLGGVPRHLWRVGGIVLLTTGLALVLLLLFDGSFLANNLANGCRFVASGYFALYLGVAVLLALPQLSGRRYELAVFLLASGYLFCLYGESLHFYRMNGDNVCQVAYWRILWQPNLAGGLGVSAAKPGQILLLGPLHQLSLLGGPVVFQIGLCLVMAALVWSLVAVASELGGRAAGILTFLLAIWSFELDFISGESTIFVVTPVFAGLRWYYYHPRWKGLGRLLLVAAFWFRIEVIAVLAAVGLIHLARREWRDLALLAGCGLASLLAWVGVVFRIQGSFARLNSGAAAGYLGPLLADGRIDFGYIVNKVAEDYAGFYYIRFLLILNLVGLVGSFIFKRRVYLCAFASLLIIIANVFFFGGILELTRYFPLVYAFAASIGAASLVRFGYLAWRRERSLGLFGVLAIGAVLLAGFDFSQFDARLDDTSNQRFVVNAKEVLAEKALPPAARLLSEDDLLSYLVVMDPARFAAITSLQSFNAADEARRREILARTDYIWIARNDYPFYYLAYLPLAAWREDPFRKMAEDFIDRQLLSRNLYGFNFVNLGGSPDRLLLKVAVDR